jgi:hypothetical protein
MFHRTITGVIGFFLAFALTHQAAAQELSRCKNRADVLDTLEKEYTEVPMAIGITKNKRVIEILTDEKGESWTILITKADGQSCLLSSGSDWTWRKPKPHPTLGWEIAAPHDAKVHR